MTTASQVYDCVKLLLRNEVFHPSAVSGVNVAATRPVSFFTLRDISACTTTRKCQCVFKTSKPTDQFHWHNTSYV